MAAASQEFNNALSACEFNEAYYPIVQNVTASAQSNGIAIKEILQKQMTSSVLWCQTIKYMIDQGVTAFIEIGPGKALSGMVKRIDKTMQTYNVEDSSSLSTTVAALSERVEV